MLSKIASALPHLVQKNINNQRQFLNNKVQAYLFVANRHKTNAETKTKILSETLRQSTANVVNREKQRLAGIFAVVEALSPQNTLRRGYSITRLNGKAIKNSDNINIGQIITTEFANGSIDSIINKK